MRHWFVIVTVAVLSACALSATEDASDLPALNEAAQGKRFAAFQVALEYGGSDRTDGWCRSYEELIADGGKRYRVVGIACRKAAQRWLVLDVRPFTEGG